MAGNAGPSPGIIRMTQPLPLARRALMSQGPPGCNQYRRLSAMPGTIDKKLEELGIELPVPAAPIANYVGFVRSGRLLFVSGQICLADGTLVATGKLGQGVTVEQGQAAAR